MARPTRPFPHLLAVGGPLSQRPSGGGHQHTPDVQQSNGAAVDM